MSWKKIIVLVLLLIVGGFAHLIFMFGSVAFLWLVFVVLYIIFSVLFVTRNFKKIFIILIAAILLFEYVLLETNFPNCDLSFKGGDVYACDCKGLLKRGLGSTECIGRRTECYNFSAGERVEWMLNSSGIKKEISCEEIDRYNLKYSIGDNEVK